MRTQTIPETPEELTSAWLAANLDRPIDAVSVSVLGTGQGFMGDVLRLCLTTADSAEPVSLVAKMPKRANRAMGEMLGVYEREICFFDELAQSVPARLPAVYYTYFDRDAGSEKQAEILAMLNRLPLFLSNLVAGLGRRIAAHKQRRYLIIMEDLGDMAAGDQLAGASLEACARVLAGIAPVHNRFWDSPLLENRFWLLPLNIDSKLRFGMFKRALPAFRASADPALGPYLDWLERHGLALAGSLGQGTPETLLHCDLRLDNVCFGETECALLDWQLVRRGPAAYDVAYFLGGALDVGASQDDEQTLLADYHRALAVPGYEFEAFATDYQRALLHNLSALATSGDIEIDAGRGQSMMAVWLSRLAARLQNVDLDRIAATLPNGRSRPIGH